MSENLKPCPYCRQPISDEAIKCHHCQSPLIKSDSPSLIATEKIAALVVKSVGAIPILMGVLLIIAGIFGIKTLNDVADFAKRAEVAVNSIEGQKKLISKLVVAEIERNIDSLLNDLSVDSVAPRALRTRQELRELLAALEQQGTGSPQSASRGLLLRALFAYYEQKYDEGLALLSKADEDLNKFRLLGIISMRKAEIAERANRVAEARKLYEDAAKHLRTAESMAERENRRLSKNKANRATSMAKLGQHKEAEAIFLDLIGREPDELLHYYNIATLYSLWGNLQSALDYLEKGVSRGLARSGDLTRRDLDEDPDFKNLRASTTPEIQRRYAELRKKLPEK